MAEADIRETVLAIIDDAQTWDDGVEHYAERIMGLFAADRERQAAEITRLQSGGCARDQATTQYCAEAAAFAAEVAELRAEVERLRNPWRPISDCPEDEGVLIATTGDHVGCGFWVAHRDDPDVREWYWSGAGCQRMHPNLKPLGWKPLPAGLSAPPSRVALQCLTPTSRATASGALRARAPAKGRR